MNNDILIDEQIQRRLKEENPEVPMNIHEGIQKTVNRISSKRKKRTGIRYIAAAVLVVMISCIGLGVANPSYAKGLPVIGSVFKALDKLLYSNYDKYEEKLNISTESNGYKMTLNSVVFDGKRLTLAYTFESKLPLFFKPNGIDIYTKVNKSIENQMAVANISGELSEDKKVFKGVADTLLTNQDDAGTSSYINAIEKLDLEVVIKGIYEAETGNEITGYWGFNTTIKNKQVVGKIKEKHLDIKLDSIENGMKLTKVTFSPLNTILIGQNLNNRDGISCFAFDNMGRNLPMKNIGTSDLGDFQISFKEIYANTKEITIIPYKHIEKSKQKTRLLSAALNLKGATNIQLGTHGVLKITEVESTKGKTKLHFVCDFGEFIAPMVIEDKATGEKVNITQKWTYNEDKGEYIVSFNKELADKEYLVQYPDLDGIFKVYDELKFKIEVNN